MPAKKGLGKGLPKPKGGGGHGKTTPSKPRKGTPPRLPKK